MTPVSPSEPAFRVARQADAPALVALIERAYRSPETAGAWDSESHLLRGPRTSLDEIAALIADADSRFLIAETDASLAGCCLIQRRDHDAYFGMFAINPDSRSSGLGKRMLAHAESEAVRLWNAPEMMMTVISVRDALIAWYERRGYRLTGVRFPFPFSETTGETRRDFDLVEMRKVLRATPASRA